MCKLASIETKHSKSKMKLSLARTKPTHILINRNEMINDDNDSGFWIKEKCKKKWIKRSGYEKMIDRQDNTRHKYTNMQQYTRIQQTQIYIEYTHMFISWLFFLFLFSFNLLVVMVMGE